MVNKPETIVVFKRLKGSRPFPLGYVQFHDGVNRPGWTFLPNVFGRSPSRKAWPTAKEAIPHWARKGERCTWSEWHNGVKNIVEPKDGDDVSTDEELA